MLAYASMVRSQRTQVFRSLIALPKCNQLAVLPIDDLAGSDGKRLRRNAFRKDRALRFREAIERAAARVVGDPELVADHDTVDAGWKLRGAIAEESQSEKTAQKSARDRLQSRLHSLGEPDSFCRWIGYGEDACGDRGAAAGKREIDRNRADVDRACDFHRREIDRADFRFAREDEIAGQSADLEVGRERRDQHLAAAPELGGGAGHARVDVER